MKKLIAKENGIFIVISLLCMVLSDSKMKNGNDWVESSPVTNWGDWGFQDECDSGQHVIGFQLKTERKQGNDDDTALNAVKLLCGRMGSRNTEKTITSHEGPWGQWGDMLYCDGFMIGFQLRSEAHQNDTDQTAANNFRAFCAKDITFDVVDVTGDGTDWGHWSLEARCARGSAVCGIQTQVEKILGPGLGKNDDTSLNNIRLKCCPVVNEGKTCSPSDKWKEVVSCDNRQSPSETTCSYSKSIGTSSTKSNTIGGMDDTKNSLDIGWGFAAEVASLKTNFEQMLGSSTTTGTNWNEMVTKTWTNDETVGAIISTPPGKWLVLKQVIGTCGSFMVSTAKFHIVDVTLKNLTSI